MFNKSRTPFSKSCCPEENFNKLKKFLSGSLTYTPGGYLVKVTSMKYEKKPIFWTVAIRG